MTVARGDVVILNFPQGSGQPPKRRPAVVVQSNHNNTRLSNSIFAMLTSNTSLASSEATQLLIDLNTPQGRQSGLAHSSAVKCENIHTLPQASVIRTVGSLPEDLMRQIDDCLKESLGLA